MNKKLNIGIIGAGNIVKRHCQAYRCLGELARLIAVADVDRKRADDAKRAYKFKEAYDDHRKLLERNDVDVVSVCTPANFHASIVIDAIKAGKHVLCEKPIAGTLAEADRIIKTADEHPAVIVSVVYQCRTEPAHARVRSLIEAGQFGRILTGGVRVRAMRMPAYYAAVPGRGSWKSDGGGVLINQAVHQLDALVSLLGVPVEVSATMDTFIQPTEAEDTLTGWVRFQSGALATVEATTCSHEDTFEMEVLGENAAYALHGRADSNLCTWDLTSRSAAVRRALRARGLHEHPPAPDGPGIWRVRAQKIMCKLRKTEWLPPKHWGHTPHIQEFLTRVQAGGPAPIPPREARKSVDLVAALYESALTRRRVSLPLDDTSPVYEGVDPSRIPEREPERTPVSA